MTGQRFDVVVVGGGPSGATAADVLAMAGKAVVLLDKAGRIKPCGGAIPPRLIKDFEIPDALLCAKIRSARMVSPRQKTVDMPIDARWPPYQPREYRTFPDTLSKIGTDRVGIDALDAHDRCHRGQPCGPDMVMDGFERGMSMLVVDNDEVQSGQSSGLDESAVEGLAEHAGAGAASGQFVPEGHRLGLHPVD